MVLMLHRNASKHASMLSAWCSSWWQTKKSDFFGSSYCLLVHLESRYCSLLQYSISFGSMIGRMNIWNLVAIIRCRFHMFTIFALLAMRRHHSTESSYNDNNITSHTQHMLVDAIHTQKIILITSHIDVLWTPVFEFGGYRYDIKFVVYFLAIECISIKFTNLYRIRLYSPNAWYRRTA